MAAIPTIQLHSEHETRLARVIREIEEEVTQKYAGRYRWAGRLGRAFADFRINSEIEDRLERLWPRLPWLLQADRRPSTVPLAIYDGRQERE